MSRKQKWIYSIALGVLIFTLLAVCIITADAPDRSVQFSNNIPAYESILPPAHPPLHVAYEAQAIPLMEAGVAKSYRTDFISTIIIAADRDQVRDEITGWSCLRTGDYQVYFGYKGRLSHIEFGYAFLSMMAGLDDEDGGYNDTIHLLKYLHKTGRLTSDDPSAAPVAIMFDYQAAQMQKDGRNVEIIVPAEGTLSFPAGIMSTYTDNLPHASPEDLIAAGFRLPNGHCDFSIYPDPEHYTRAQNAVLNPETAAQIISGIVSFQRQVLGKRLLSPANGVENILAYIAFIIITVLWTGLLYMRISDKALQKKLFAISVLLLFWMLIRIIRLLILDGTVDRFLWYLYYIPLIFLPALLFWVGQILAKNQQSRFSGIARKASLLTSLFLTLLVLTNDFHQMAFSFYRGTEGNNYDLYYSYGWVYYFVFIWSLLLIFAFVFLAARKKNESAAKRAGPLLLILCFSVTYFGGYAFGIPIFRESEFSIVYGIMTLLFLEACFRNRLIPNNDKLGALLLGAPIDMHILSDAMQIEYKTNFSEELPAEIVGQVRRHMRPEDNSPYSLSLPGDESVLYGVYRINGGYTVFARHLDSVIRLRSTLAEQNEKIKNQNSILARTQKIKGEIARLRAQQELFSRIESVLKERVNRIDTIFSAIPVNSGEKRERREIFRKQLAVIKTLVNYCKRRGNLALLEANDEYCQTDSIALWLQESIWEAATAGVDGLVTESGSTRIHSTPASLLYDCFEHILENAMKYTNAVLLVNLSAAEDSVLLRVAVETSPVIGPSFFRLEKALYDVLDSAGASYDIREQEHSLTIRITVPKGGNNCD
jgi:hypothetical protein